MANNCQLVRRARRKWYRRLTDKCNMHDRHSGVGVEVPAVYVEVQEENRAPPAADLNADVSCAEVRVTFGTLNIQVKNLDEGFQDILCKCDILCLQEVTPSCVEDLLQIARSHGYEVATAMGRGSVSAEPFDVCMLLKTVTIRKLRMSVSPLAPESPRRLLAVQVQLRGNGAILAIGTVHLTASPEGQPQRLAELESALCTLQALQVDGQLLVGDLNMQRDEDLTSTEEFWTWNDAWHCAGQDPSNSLAVDFQCSCFRPCFCASEFCRIGWRGNRLQSPGRTAASVAPGPGTAGVPATRRQRKMRSVAGSC